MLKLQNNAFLVEFQDMRQEVSPIRHPKVALVILAIATSMLEQNLDTHLCPASRIRRAG
jgi:hypothetical protein